MADKIYGIISIKGGVGKTTCVSNLGTALAKVFNKKVLLVDANYSAPNLGIHLGIIEKNIKTIHDVLNGKTKIENAILSTDHGFDFIPADPKGSIKFGSVSQLKSQLNKIKDNYDLILIDSSPNLNNEILSTMLASDKLLAVSTPDYPTLSSTMHAVKVAKRKKTPILGIVLNRVYDKDFELSIEDIENAAEVPVLASLPHEISIMEALSNTTPAVLHTPKSDAVIEYCKLAGSLVGEDYKDPRIFSKIKKLFGLDSSQTQKNRESLIKKK